ncbi:MAG: Ig-like domain-containing protein [Gammaproteobacteria bacterium]|nr:Ig-like domain-containing protein [Gammaproteobacteria bacterium]
MNGLRLLITAAFAATLMACEETPSTANLDSVNESFFANFSPADSVIPFPNNLLFNGSTDATLNIPTTGLTAAELGLVNALNSMDGFSTVAPMSTTFSSAIDSSTLIAGTTVRVFEVTLSGVGGAVLPTPAPVEVAATDFVATVSSVDGSDVNNPDPGANKLVITPLKPLLPGTSYAVILTNGIKDTAGNSAAADLVYTFTKNETELISTPAATQADVNYAGLLLGFDADGSGLPLDAGEETVAVASITALEGVRQLTKFTEDAIVANATPAVTKSEIILSWVFTTQTTAVSANHVLKEAKAKVPTNPAHNINSAPAMTTSVIGGLGFANIHVGTIDVPYYLAAINDPELGVYGPAIGHWENSGGNGSFVTPVDRVPVAQSTQTIPLLVSIPNSTSPVSDGSKPAAGWPVVIFQHGITADRTSLLAIADSLAARGFAAVAIDLPMHGLASDSTIRLATEVFDGNAQERTFDVDYVNNTTGLSPGDGITDTSGANYVNLPNMMTTRDNVYQSIADLFVLTQSLYNSTATTGMSYDGDAVGDFDPTKIYFVGHSLGAIVGASFLAIETNVQDAVLAMPGGGIAKLLDGSASFGPVIASGLGSAGVNKGTAEYETFLASAQMMIDAGDPVNYASTLANSTQGILMFEVVGDGATNLPDLVVPNAVPDDNDTAGTVAAPLSGTDPLITLMGLTQFDADDATTNNHAVVKFTEGDHRSLLDPAASAAVTTEMQYETAEFLLDTSGGTTDDGVLDVNVSTGTILLAP